MLDKRGRNGLTRHEDWPVVCLLLGMPFLSLMLEQIWTGIFATLLKPIIAPETVSASIPKLYRDLKFYAEKWPHLDPEPYLYWYFATLMICTLVGLALIPRLLVRSQVPQHRDFMARRWERSRPYLPWPWSSARVSAALMISVVLFGCAVIFMVTLVGPVQFGGRITVGFRHEAYMALLLACYGSVIAGGPAAVSFWTWYRYRTRDNFSE